MTLAAFPGGALLYPHIPIAGPLALFATAGAGGIAFTSPAVTMDAASPTEKVAFIGHVHWNGRPSSAKTFGTSSKISVKTGAVTCTTGTTIRVGIQDVLATGVTFLQPDGSWDVYKDVAGGTDLTSSDDNIIKTWTMASGSKSISHGALVAVVLEMTARAGTDSVIIIGATRGLINSSFPVVVTDEGSGWASSKYVAPNVLLEADDGTLGVLEQCPFILASASWAFQASTTPDEHALLFRVPWRCKIDSILVSLSSNDTAADATVALYSSPLSSPAEVVSVSYIGDYGGASANERQVVFPLGAEYELQANTTYAVAVKATGTANLEVGYATLNNADHRTVQGLANCSHGYRSDGSGAFTEVTTEIPLIQVGISSLDDGTGMGACSMNIGGIC